MGRDYIDEKKAASRRKDIRVFEGKSTCSSALAPNGSCELRQCLRKLSRARFKAGQITPRNGTRRAFSRRRSGEPTCTVGEPVEMSEKASA